MAEQKEIHRLGPCLSIHKEIEISNEEIYQSICDQERQTSCLSEGMPMLILFSLYSIIVVVVVVFAALVCYRRCRFRHFFNVDCGDGGSVDVSWG